MNNVGAGVSRKVVEALSSMKSEPEWMRAKRLEALSVFEQTPLPAWGPVDRLRGIDFARMRCYVDPGAKTSKSWDDVPREIREKYDALGIPSGEQEFLAGLGAQFESGMIYHSLKEELKRQGIIFESMDEAVACHPDLVRRYFGTVVSVGNNKFSALNGAMWSGGSFVHVPEGVCVDAPLHNFFQMQASRQGQFERTLIVAEEGSSLEFLEGCVAPLFSEVSVHAGVVEIVVKQGANVKYSTMQNWSKNVLNLVTKSSRIESEGSVTWVDGNVGSGVTMKYPSMILAGRKAKGRLLSLSFAGDGQVIDSGGKAIHLAPETHSQIESKSIVKRGGRTSFRGDIKIAADASDCRSSVQCVSLHLESGARSDTYPRVQAGNKSSLVEHESSVVRIGEEQLLYVRSRGIGEQAARGLVVAGFVESFSSLLPMEYAVEFDRLIEMEVGDGIG